MAEDQAIRIGGRYLVQEQLGAGGMGVVYAATDEATGERLALKQLRLSASRSYPRAALLFEREYHTLMQLRHPHIVQAYDYGLAPEGPFYTMELLDGADLDRLSPCHWPEVCRIVRDLATALALLHSRRLVHRDVSPRNARRTSEGRTKLIDFGAMTSMAISVDLVGTPPFTAPEAYYRQPLDPRADLFGLGALAYWLLTGRHAFPANGFSELPELWKLCPESPSTLSRDVPPALDELVRVLLSEKPLARPRSAAEVIERIDALCGDASVPELDAAQGYLLTPSLVGRQRELEELHERLRLAIAGHGAVVAVEGPTGIGRTRLLQEIAVEAKLHGAVSLTGDASGAHQGDGAVVRALFEECRRALPDSIRDDDLSREIVRFLDTPPGETNGRAADPRERRARLLSALRTFLLRVSRQKPVVVTIDDIHACDDFSVSLLASLTDAVSRHPLLLVVSIPADTRHELLPRPLSGASRLRLNPLSESDTLELVQSLFGDVPNVSRLAAWVHERAQGNVLFVLELVAHLCRSGDVRYEGGAWIVAPAFRTAEAPAKLEQAFAARVGALRRDARELAELCAVYDGEIQLSACRRAWVALRGRESASAKFFDALDELAYADFITIEGSKCSYRQYGLRKAVLQSMSASRARELHRYIGESLLRLEARTTPDTLRAAWHLMQAGEDEAGVDLIVDLAQDLVAMQSAGESAVPIVEAAFERFERLSRPLRVRIHAQRGLLQYAYIYDTSLAKRAAPVLSQLSMDCGLALAASMDPRVSPGERLQKGMQEAAARFESTPVNERGLPPGEAMVELIRAALAMMGVAVLWYDIDVIEQLDTILEPLSALGETSGAGVAVHCSRTLRAAMRGFDRSAVRMRLRLLELLQDPQCFSGVPAEARVHLIATQLHAQGAGECFLYPERALERAASIEALSLKMYEGAALQIRFLVELCRGHAVHAEEYRQQLERVALQSGFGHQNEMWLVRSVAGPYSMWGDVLALKQTMRDLEEVAASYPGYEPFYQNARAAYHRERAEFDLAIDASERALALARPGRHAAWLQTLPIHVDTLVAAERYEEALRFATEHLTARPVEGVDYERLEAFVTPGLCVAAAALGDLDGALERLGAYERARVRPGESDLFSVRSYESKARIALVTKDAQGFLSSTRALADHCRALQNPALIARCERLVEAGRREKLISSPLSSPPPSASDKTRTAAGGDVITGRATPSAKADP